MPELLGILQISIALNDGRGWSDFLDLIWRSDHSTSPCKVFLHDVAILPRIGHALELMIHHNQRRAWCMK